jgi:hypothetical protein
MTEDDEMDELEARMRAKLQVPEQTPEPEKRAIEKAKADPLPAKVLVQRLDNPGHDGMFARWFFFEETNPQHHPPANGEA